MTFEVTLLPSGNRFECAPDQEILKAGLAAGLMLPFSCRSGMCRTCRGKVVKGEVDFGAAHDKYLSNEDRAQGLALLCCAFPRGNISVEVEEVDLNRSNRPKRMPARVLEIQQAAPDVCIVKLGLPANEPLVYQPGQFLDVLLADGKRRSYSIANAPRAEGVRQLELHIRHMPGGVFTDYVFSQLKLREMLQIEVPLGQFRLMQDSDRSIVFMATGTGFAPIKAMVQHLIDSDVQRPMRIYWGGRHKRDLYQYDLAAAWAQQHSHIAFIPVLSQASAEDQWQGRTGYVQQAVLQDLPSLANHEVYACGSPAMVADAEREFLESGQLPAAQYHADAFITEADRFATLSN